MHELYFGYPPYLAQDPDLSRNDLFHAILGKNEIQITKDIEDEQALDLMKNLLKKDRSERL